MTDTSVRSAEDMVAEADTGARNAGPFAAKLIFGLCIAWSLFQLYIASKLPGVLAQATGISHHRRTQTIGFGCCWNDESHGCWSIGQCS